MNVLDRLNVCNLIGAYMLIKRPNYIKVLEESVNHVPVEMIINSNLRKAEEHAVLML